MKKLKAPKGAHYDGRTGEVEVPDYDVAALLARGWTLVAGADPIGEVATTLPTVAAMFGEDDEETEE